MQARTLTAAHGWRWFAAGYALFRKAPSRLGMIVMLYWLAVLLLNGLPFIGPLVASILMPGLSVGVMNACRMVDMGEAVEPPVLLSGLKKNRKPLLIMGALYLLCSLLALSFSAMADGGLLLSVMTGQTPLTEETFTNPDLLLASLTVLGAMVPVLMAYWYAPQLSSWYNLSIGKAFFFSFIACQRNWAAFLAYGVSLFVFAALLPITLLGLVGAIFPESTGFVAAILTVPMIMILGPTLLASFYVSYRDVFAVSENA